jgi:hypothetical protein
MNPPPIKTGLAPIPTPAEISRAAPFALAGAVAAGATQYEIPRPRDVFNQGNSFCCVSCALAGAMESLHPSWPALSPVFHYHVTRYDNSGADTDGQLFLDSALGTLAAQGICRQDLHPVPFTDDGPGLRPSAEAYSDALTHVLPRDGKRPRWKLVSGPSVSAAIRDELNLDHPVVIAFRLPCDCSKWLLPPAYEWRDPIPLAANGHCALIFGYSDSRRAFHVHDSRGSDKFNAGCWWMAYSIIDSPVLQAAYSLT